MATLYLPNASTAMSSVAFNDSNTSDRGVLFRQFVRPT